MDKKKVTTEVDYAQALVRVEQLMFKVLPCSEEGEELEKLSKMIEAYENEHFLYIDEGAKAKRKAGVTPGISNAVFVPKKKPPQK